MKLQCITLSRGRITSNYTYYNAARFRQWRLETFPDYEILRGVAKEHVVMKSGNDPINIIVARV